jgi:hypothetical protein
MRSVGLLAALTIVALAASLCPAFAQNAAWLGRGGTGVALTNEDATGYINPAGLARLGAEGFPVEEGDNWVGQFGYAHDASADVDEWAAQASARRLGADWGASLGYGWWDGDKEWFAGFGKALKAKGDNHGWYAGALVWNSDYSTDVATGSVTSAALVRRNKMGEDLGLQYVNKATIFGYPSTVSLGATLIDLTDEFQRYVDAGIGIKFSRLTLAADFNDVFDDTYDGNTTNLGAEYKVCKYVTGRIGSMDSDFTWGASFQKDNLALDFGATQPEDFHWVRVVGLRYGRSF